ncbi:hypothetical protein RRG08_065167 [Elysia crispata]|uniref:Uncharacterized protein n=1 Tax=Elysia crispata TaxID=231223 RepID=A0AAE1D7R4_9GAST|nr:hypothetical protein RRG08_065167 [Elysia crispata]
MINSKEMAGEEEPTQLDLSQLASADSSVYDDLEFNLVEAADEPVSDSDLFHSSLETWQAQASTPTRKSPVPYTTKKKRVLRETLTLETKKKILEEVARGRSRMLICKEYKLPHSTLSEILKRKDEILFAVSSSVFTPQRKRMRTSKYNELETELWSWYVDMTKKKGVTISGPEIVSQAKIISTNMKLEDFTATSGWLCRFKQRHGIQMVSRPRVKTADEEDSDTKPSKSVLVSTPSTFTWTSKILPEIMRRYSPRDIFTADTHYQPASQGILQTVKQNYRRSIIQRRLHIAEVNGPREECQINLVDALHWLRSAWKDVHPQTIYKSFQNAEFILPSYDSMVPQGSLESSHLTPSSNDAFQLECDEMIGTNGQIVMDAEYRHMFERLAKKIVLDPFITAESYASLDDQVVTYGHMTEEELMVEAAKTQAADDEEDEDEDKDEEEEVRDAPPPTAIEAKQCLSRLAKFFATERGTERFFDKISSLYKDVSRASLVTPESNIIDLFSKKPRKPQKKKKATPATPIFIPI